jgi:hypothetical protein
MVNYITSITFNLDSKHDIRYGLSVNRSLQPDAVRQLANVLTNRLERVAAMMDLLATQGFTFQAGKNCIEGYSDSVEAQDAKQYLQKHGFHDHEFQVRLEYVRQWGVM